MTIPAEHKTSLTNTRDFLSWLLTDYNSKTKVSEVRERAYRCMRHFPFPYNVDIMLDPIIKKWEDELGGH